MVKVYVVGFVIVDGRVVLIRKNRPAWQAGRLNGVGGKVEPGETGSEAMAREFEEETGEQVPAHDWEHVCTIEWPDDQVRVADAEATKVMFYRHLAPFMPFVQSMTDEEVVIRHVASLATEELIPNLTWLLPLAAYTADKYSPFTVQATVAEAVT